jgi:hypothetical protein
MRPHPTVVEFDDGRSAILGITRAPTRIPRLLRDTLSPEGNCGGWVSSDPLDGNHIRALTETVLEARSCTWRIGPADQATIALAPAGGREELTHVINLCDGPEAARARWQAEARRTAGRARRRGARVIEGTTESHWDAYTELYRASVRRWDQALVTYRDSLFSLLAGFAGRGVRLWLVEIDGEPCAGAILLMHHQYATYWHGASEPERCPGATNLLQWQLIEHLAEEGIHTYDLNGSGPLSGVIRFKESIGAERRPVLAFECRHPLERAASRAKRLIRGQR